MQANNIKNKAIESEFLMEDQNCDHFTFKFLF